MLCKSAIEKISLVVGWALVVTLISLQLTVVTAALPLLILWLEETFLISELNNSVSCTEELCLLASKE